MILENEADLMLAVLAGSFLFFLLCTFLVVFIALARRKRQRHAIETRLLEVQFAETLLRTQLEIKEQTLQQVAHELHDNIGQVASLVKINLLTLKIDPADALKAEDTRELVRQLIGDIKELSVSLNSDRIVTLGFVNSLETEVQRLNRTGMFHASLDTGGINPNLSPEICIILFRMVQEVLNNAVKHSGAKNIAIRFRSTENFFILLCTDDGAGFIQEEKLNAGSGLSNLQRRAKLIRATLQVQSTPGSGTSVTIFIPV